MVGKLEEKTNHHYYLVHYTLFCMFFIMPFKTLGLVVVVRYILSCLTHGYSNIFAPGQQFLDHVIPYAGLAMSPPSSTLDPSKYRKENQDNGTSNS